mgnify:CR=1 FL=1
MVTLQKGNKEIHYDENNYVLDSVYANRMHIDIDIKNVVLDRKEQNIKCTLVYTKGFERTIDEACFQINCEGELADWTTNAYVEYSEYIMLILEESYDNFISKCVKDMDFAYAS